MTLSLQGSETSGWRAEEPKSFLNGAYDELDPTFSPDGR